MTNAYLYRAALLCEACALSIRESFRAENRGIKFFPHSDHYPHGPYPQGGGEADCPQHCDECGTFLENPLTDDGVAYVRNAILMHARANSGNPEVLDLWRDFYHGGLMSRPVATSSYLNRRLRTENEVMAAREGAL